jgi:hypothetical protein
MKLPEIDFSHFRMTNREVEAFAQGLAAAAPKLVHVGTIGNTREGTPIVLLTITDFACDEPKYGYFVQGNIHSHELSGTLAGLHVARQLVAEHHSGDILSRVVFYIIARCNPDGAARMALHSGAERSAWGAPSTLPNRIRPCDVDGNGRIRVMRIPCANGDMVKNPLSPEFCMTGRTPDAPGPYYKQLPEGVIENWDGHTIPGWNDFYYAYQDWNRNWPTFWKAEQFGSGSAPLSEPEVKLQADFIEAHPEIIGALAFHNGWGACMTPPNTHNPLPEGEQEFFAELLKIASECTGYPAFRAIDYGSSAVNETFGQFQDYCIYERGFHCMLIELGTIETSAGLSTTQLMTMKDTYSSPYAVLEFEKTHPEVELATIPWKKFNHPQLGEVEIGGLDAVAFANPAAETLQKAARGAYQYVLRHAELACKHFAGKVERRHIK